MSDEDEPSNEEGSDDAKAAGSDDPTDIVSIAVTVEDVVAALEATERGAKTVVLRVTPPFSGRMRARLHVVDATPDTTSGGPDPVHITPTSLVDDPPSYPEVDETEDLLRERDDYTRERHRRRHVDAVESWRTAVRSSITDRVTIPTEDGPHEIEVKTLG